MENRPRYKLIIKCLSYSRLQKSAANIASYIPKSANILQNISRRCLHNDDLQLGETIMVSCIE